MPRYTSIRVTISRWVWKVTAYYTWHVTLSLERLTNVIAAYFAGGVGCAARSCVIRMCTACVSMRGLIYRSQGCLVSLTSTVNTVILNLHPAKGSKLRNNYARPRLEGVARTPKGCTEYSLWFRVCYVFPRGR